MSTVIWKTRLSDSGERLVWFQRLGYVRIRDLIRVAIFVYLFFAALVTFLTEDIITVVFLALFAIVVLNLATVDRFSPRRRVNVYPEAGLYIAEHLGTGVVRHGETPEKALTALDDSFTPIHHSPEAPR